MGQIRINTGLSGFSMVDAVTAADEESIAGVKYFEKTPAIFGLEALVQLAALDVRRRMDFEKHAFLMKIESADLDFGMLLDGRFYMNGQLTGSSSNSFSYVMKGNGADGTVICVSAIISTQDYGDRFQRAQIQTRYRQLYTCLLNGSKKS